MKPTTRYELRPGECLPDTGNEEISRRIEQAVAGLNQANETNALAWIETVTEHRLK